MADIVSSTRTVSIPADGFVLHGDLGLPAGAHGIVLFAHGSGSSRHSPRNRRVAEALRRAGFATLLLDLLTLDEERTDFVTAHLRFDIGLLADRLALATEWLLHQPDTRSLAIGYFGASTGAAAALVASVRFPRDVRAVVARGGRPDLAAAALPAVTAPVLLVVGDRDTAVVAMNRRAAERMTCPNQLVLVPGATHLFEEPGTLDRVAELATEWFARTLVPAPA
jgi:dienelactone hydrolase